MNPAISLSVLLAVVPVAPTQVAPSPEGAREFLRLVLPNVRVAAPEGAADLESGVRLVVPYQADRGICEMFSHVRQSGDPAIHSWLIKWSSVQEVGLAGSVVTVKQSSVAEPVLQFHFLSENTAARAAYAMDFLRIHCDPTAATGF